MEQISNDIYRVISKIKKEFPSFIFGGSLALSLNGFLNRKVKDIDLIFFESDINRALMFKLLSLQSANRGDDYYSQSSDYVRFDKRIEGIDICLFIYNDNNINKIKVENFTMPKIGEIKLQHYDQIIGAKRDIIEECPPNKRHKPNIKKHIDDIAYFKKRLAEQKSGKAEAISNVDREIIYDEIQLRLKEIDQKIAYVRNLANKVK